MNHIFVLLINIYNFLLGLMAFVAMLVIVVAGLRMLLFQFNEKPEAELENAKLMLRRGIFGIVIIITAFLLVNVLLLLLGVQAGFFRNYPALQGLVP